ncbi:nuclease-related domain-containing protein [Alkalibacillus silvisoli]|uniref:NERD domain-containing protein n=1 Tax=Alkalibacillus silvisoli TaxID=392823 RepID=A0ABN0ZQM0_9BACI
MAQLIKLQDYISRYETDIYRYPTQFLRLKKENYEAIHAKWLQEQENQLEPSIDEEPDSPGRWKRWFKKRHESNEEIQGSTLPETEEELKYQFLEKIYHFQLKWASSTLQEVSFLDPHYELDERLKYFLKRFPDTYLILYQPIFRLKQALFEIETIMITPTSIICLNWLNDDEDDTTTYEPIDQRKWLKRVNGEKSTIVNPNLALKRSEGALRNILNYKEINYPIKKLVLSMNGTINHHHTPYQTEYIDIKNYESWFNENRQTKTPLKHQQLKVANALLQHTQITSISRPEWEEVDEELDPI